MNEFTPQQIGILERLVSNEFVLVAFPLYANAVGVRKGNCAALLDPIANGGFRVFGEPCMLLEGNLTVRITEKGKTWFVWKKQRLEGDCGAYIGIGELRGRTEVAPRAAFDLIFM